MIDTFVKIAEMFRSVIPAEAGIQFARVALDSGLRRSDGGGDIR
jgi:hypothetical protein